MLDYLADAPPDGAWEGWRIARIGGGANNLLYRAAGDQGDFAIKFTIRDQRDRAGREYRALLALEQAGLVIAPRPVLLDRESYAQPAVVQTWLDGMVSSRPPEDDAEWRALLGHFAAIHRVTPGATGIPLVRAFINMRSAADGLDMIREQMNHIPAEAWPASLCALFRRVEAWAFPAWPAPAPALCRVDANLTNMIRRPGAWASVDWENSGWGDPAFEIADIMTHPAYMTVPGVCWEWAIGVYCALVGDPAAATRIATYYPLMLAWWVARLARMLYEVPRGLDRRLVERPPGWEEEMRGKYERYLELARGVFVSAHVSVNINPV